MALPEGEALHANRAVFLGPTVAGQPQRVLWTLAEVALLVGQPCHSARVKVCGGLDLCPDAKGPPHTFPRHL